MRVSDKMITSFVAHRSAAAKSAYFDAIGKATSGTWSPTLKKYCVIARVKPRYGQLGTTINMEATIHGQRFTVPATVVKMPFFDPARKKG